MCEFGKSDIILKFDTFPEIWESLDETTSTEKIFERNSSFHVK